MSVPLQGNVGWGLPVTSAFPASSLSSLWGGCEVVLVCLRVFSHPWLRLGFLEGGLRSGWAGWVLTVWLPGERKRLRGKWWSLR